MALNEPAYSRPENLGPSDIPYVLSEEYGDYLQKVPTTILGGPPSGFPSRVESSLCWTADALEECNQEWTLSLTPEEACAIEEAVKGFMESETPMSQIGPETFHLPQLLKEKLDQISAACYHGRGFCILRGLQIHKRSEEESAVIFAGVSSHVAVVRGSQDIDRKHKLAHLFKKHRQEANEYIAPSFNDAPLAFHTDDGDIVALYYASLMEQGGLTQLASQPMVYNELAANRPDLLRILAQNWLIDTYFGKSGEPARCLPLLHRHGESGITIQYSRLPFSRYDGSKPRRADIPSLSEVQIQALNCLQAISNKIKFSVPTKPGDILYFNNVGLFHARERYQDSGTINVAPESHDRHLLRLWLQDPKRTTTLAPPIQKIWDGIYEKGREEAWCIHAKDAFAMNMDKNG